MKIVLLLSILFAVCLAKRIPNPYEIIGGRDAKPGEVPWIVDLHTNTAYFCVGSILDKRTILTAAHCLDKKTAENIRVHVGSLKRSYGGYNISVAKIIQHNLYNKTTSDYDIALLKLSSDIPIDGKTIAAVNLPPAESDPPTGQEVLIAGWGSTDAWVNLPEHLKVVSVNIVSREKCKLDLEGYEVNDRMVCDGIDAGGKDSCVGDSGSPLITGNTQIGIVSWGIGCAEKDLPGVNTRVGVFIDWIKQNIL